MSPRASFLTFEFQVNMIPCPPENVDGWRAGVRAWMRWMMKERSDKSLPDSKISNENSRRKKREVPKFTAFSCPDEQCEKVSLVGDGDDVA